MRVSYSELKQQLQRVLLSRGVEAQTADACAGMFADTTAWGVHSHGVNRFPRFIQQLDAGDIDPTARPERLLTLGAVEQWDAHLGIGNLTARQMMDRAMALADDRGIGLVALRNANHWMRGGAYGWQAAEKGYIGLCWTNSLAVMPPWGAKNCRIGTNPLIIAVPGEPITLVDMSMSMFSYGALELARLAGESLPVDGGYDNAGQPTRDPAVLEANRRILPMGYWKGSALSVVLDMLATLLSGGLSVAEISEDQRDEYGVSQVFIAVRIDALIDDATRDRKLQRIRDYLTGAEPVDPAAPVRLPGQNLPQTFARSLREGITIDDGVWQRILALQEAA
ncbi:3-dehydro-L-gulonate 2-dehydrogenase [Pantoea sp. 1.19]|uniref:3-dehydro-L-gulonate 2-dehydrogenase n=1 Tax=Pantoea sp. 1.19 TaxID=1925589 RepID=UPI00094919F8|nr:3-dehydro-L-gulonate 2-dehydrogenase [Pantoea sp. 1.19]